MKSVDCEYCGEPSTREVGDAFVCEACYFDNFSYDEAGEDEPCSVCEDESDMSINGVAYCHSCYEEQEEEEVE